MQINYWMMLLYTGITQRPTLFGAHFAYTEILSLCASCSTCFLLFFRLKAQRNSAIQRTLSAFLAWTCFLPPGNS